MRSVEVPPHAPRIPGSTSSPRSVTAGMIVLNYINISLTYTNLYTFIITYMNTHLEDGAPEPRPISKRGMQRGTRKLMQNNSRLVRPVAPSTTLGLLVAIQSTCITKCTSRTQPYNTYVFGGYLCICLCLYCYCFKSQAHIRFSFLVIVRKLATHLLA